MLVQCMKCGAPLDVASNTSIVQCSYCGHYNRVRSMQTLAQQAPPGWSPPAVWTPPQQFAIAPLPYRAPPKQTSIQTLILVIVAVVLISTLCPFLFLPFLFMGQGGW